MNNINIKSALSFEPSQILINKFCIENKVSSDEAYARFQETKKFLILCACDRKSTYSPSAAVDAMWHQFLLNTKDYFMFCELVGGYVHHQPSESAEPDNPKKTLEALKGIFSDIDEHYWEQKAAKCCSGCSN